MQRRLIFENFKPVYPNLLFETVQNDAEESDSSLSSESDASDVDEAGVTGSRSSTVNILSTPVPPTSKKSADESALPKSMADLSLPTSVKQKQYKKPLKVTKVSEEELQSCKDKKRQKFEKDIDSMVGFSKVIQEISKSVSLDKD